MCTSLLKKLVVMFNFVIVTINETLVPIRIVTFFYKLNSNGDGLLSHIANEVMMMVIKYVTVVFWLW